jgi:hypothetical protein
MLLTNTCGRYQAPPLPGGMGRGDAPKEHDGGRLTGGRLHGDDLQARPDPDINAHTFNARYPFRELHTALRCQQALILTARSVRVGRSVAQ